MAHEAAGGGGLAAALACIEDSLREGLQHELTQIISRLSSNEAAVEEARKRVSSAPNESAAEVTRRLEARFNEERRKAADELEAALAPMRESLRKLRADASLSREGLAKIDTAASVSNQLKDAVRELDLRARDYMEDMDRRARELRETDIGWQRSYKEVIAQRCEGLEQRLARQQGESKGLLDRLTKLMPDAEQLREIHDQAQSSRMNLESWQRRLTACETTAHRLPALESKVTALVDRRHDEQLRDIQVMVQAVSQLQAKVSSVEGHIQGCQQQLTALEQRHEAGYDALQERIKLGLDSTRETNQRRYEVLESRCAQQQEKLQLHLEQRMADWAEDVQRDLQSVASDLERLARSSTGVKDPMTLGSSTLLAQRTNHKLTSRFQAPVLQGSKANLRERVEQSPPSGYKSTDFSSPERGLLAQGIRAEPLRTSFEKKPEMGREGNSGLTTRLEVPSPSLPAAYKAPPGDRDAPLGSTTEQRDSSHPRIMQPAVPTFQSRLLGSAESSLLDSSTASRGEHLSMLTAAQMLGAVSTTAADLQSKPRVTPDLVKADDAKGVTVAPHMQEKFQIPERTSEASDVNVSEAAQSIAQESAEVEEAASPERLEDVSIGHAEAHRASATVSETSPQPLLVTHESAKDVDFMPGEPAEMPATGDKPPTAMAEEPSSPTASGVIPEADAQEATLAVGRASSLGEIAMDMAVEMVSPELLRDLLWEDVVPTEQLPPKEIVRAPVTVSRFDVESDEESKSDADSLQERLEAMSRLQGFGDRDGVIAPPSLEDDEAEGVVEMCEQSHSDGGDRREPLHESPVGSEGEESLDAIEELMDAAVNMGASRAVSSQVTTPTWGGGLRSQPSSMARVMMPPSLRAGESKLSAYQQSKAAYGRKPANDDDDDDDDF